MADPATERAAGWTRCRDAAIVLLIALLPLINLGFGDLQAWDEGLYAMRSLGALRFGAWLDQTSVAIDGIYSALHPPLYVWLSAASMALAGVGEWAVRFPSALSFAALLFLLLAIGRRAGGRTLGPIIPLLVGLNPFVLFYARQGQFDLLLLAFLAGMMLALLVAEERSCVGWSVLAGVLLGGALMTKLLVALAILPVVLLWSLAATDRQRRRRLMIGTVAGAIGVLIALPWHLMMIERHGGGDPLFLLRQSQMLERFTTGIEGNQKRLELFYYINQLPVLFPLGAVAGLLGLTRVRRHSSSPELFAAIWFATWFLLFTLMRTKLEFYMLPMVASLGVLAGCEIARAVRPDYERWRSVTLAAGTLVAVVWSFRQEWRSEVKLLPAMLRGDVAVLTGPLILAAGLLLAALIAVLILRRPHFAAGFGRQLPFLLFVPAALHAIWMVVLHDRSAYVDGGEEIARAIRAQRAARIDVIGYETNPQLTWYLDGADAGWPTTLTIERHRPPAADSMEVRAWIDSTAGRLEEGSELLLIERDRLVRGHPFASEAVRPSGYRPVATTRRYTLFEPERLSGR